MYFQYVIDEESLAVRQLVNDPEIRLRENIAHDLGVVFPGNFGVDFLTLLKGIGFTGSRNPDHLVTGAFQETFRDTFLFSVFGASMASIDLGGVFSTAGMVGYGLWNVLYLALAITFYKVLQNRRHE